MIVKHIERTRIAVYAHFFGITGKWTTGKRDYNIIISLKQQDIYLGNEIEHRLLKSLI